MSVRRSGMRARGFTMIEALLSVLLMTVIVATLATVTSQWMRSWSRGVSRAQNVDVLTVGLDRIVADLSAAEVVSSQGAEGAPDFEGTETAVRFVRTSFGPASVPGLETVSIAEVSDERGWMIARSSAGFAPGLERAATASPAVLARGYRISFAYAGIDGNWRSSWSRSPSLPRMVRIRVSGGGLPTISTIAPIRAELPARCAAVRPPVGCPGAAAQNPEDAGAEGAR